MPQCILHADATIDYEVQWCAVYIMHMTYMKIFGSCNVANERLMEIEDNTTCSTFQMPIPPYFLLSVAKNRDTPSAPSFVEWGQTTNTSWHIIVPMWCGIHKLSGAESSYTTC